jgi:hypothetical protein
LIDPFLERAQSELPNVIAGSGALLGFDVELLQFLQFQPRVLKLTPIVDGRGTISTIPFGTMLRSVATVRSVNCSKARGSTNSMLMTDPPTTLSTSGRQWRCGFEGNARLFNHRNQPTRPLSDTRGLVLASLAQSLELLASSSFTGLFVVGFAAHFLAQSAPLAKFPEAANRLLNGLAGTNP